MNTNNGSTYKTTEDNELVLSEYESKIKWRNRMINLAKYVSLWSLDKSKVGAVLVSKKGGEITLGYNGFPFGVKDDKRLQDKHQKLNIIVHAEVNAIIAAGSRASDGELYVYGKSICARCAGPIIQSGIKQVFAKKPKEEGTYNLPTEEGAIDWEEMGRISEGMFKEAKIKVIYYEFKDTVEENDNEYDVYSFSDL
ncbi:deaminase [Photobacterium phosphoreum]|uniref:deaminase n=1 Tax=Photobacterium phosphoreum TaxID=659 RepID=UPI001E4E35D2|nr:deaminase [Photobacterium phosphoreum]